MFLNEKVEKFGFDKNDSMEAEPFGVDQRVLSQRELLNAPTGGYNMSVVEKNDVLELGQFDEEWPKSEKLTPTRFWELRNKEAKISGEENDFDSELTKDAKLKLAYFGRSNFEAMDDFFRLKGFELSMNVSRTREKKWKVVYQLAKNGKPTELVHEIQLESANQDFAVRTAESRFVEKAFPHLFEQFICQPTEGEPALVDHPKTDERLEAYFKKLEAVVFNSKKLAPVTFKVESNFDESSEGKTPTEVLKDIVKRNNFTFGINTKLLADDDKSAKISIDIEIQGQLFYQLTVQAKSKSQAKDVASLLVISCEFPTTFGKLINYLLS